ncbi:hypothetical protein PYW07_002386 [Mythimna separata]|uniref:Uncharacterized protein n=1 Tax=Mythimna separata TaxID=271217 RepID=A0AAD7YMR4_MYTSE|nr:hypothetical protein PYW07_002386 [Mythimna separata]
MEMCRVCLSSEKELVPLDETFIINYNLLTNLNITLLDGMPQYSCQTCMDTIKSFIEFREKSIIAETTLREIIYPEIKTENKTPVVEIDKSTPIYENEKVDIKSEIKEENYDDDASILDTHFDVPFSEYEEDDNKPIIKNEDDVKPTKIKKKKRKKLKVKASKLLEGIANELENKWFCGICPKTFDDKTVLNDHLNSHNKDRQCDLCREQLNSLSQLLAHRLIHVPLKQSKCHICEKKYRSCMYLEHHYRNLHIEEDDTNLICGECPVTCDTPKKLSSHILQVHSSVRYFCDICSKGFHSKINLKSHMRSHGKNKAYVCDMCGFSCKHSGGLKDHKIRKHNPARVYCKMCKRPFPSQEDHDKHKCTRKSQICPICGLQLGNIRVSQHMRKHIDIPQYECTRCPAKYKSKGALQAHLDRHDGQKTKQCEYCPAKFYTASVLIKHRRIHTGEKPYVCKVCNKGFTGNHNLKVHMKVHGEYLIVKKNTEQEDLTKFNVTKWR